MATLWGLGKPKHKKAPRGADVDRRKRGGTQTCSQAGRSRCAHIRMRGDAVGRRHADRQTYRRRRVLPCGRGQEYVEVAAPRHPQRCLRTS